MRQPVCRRGRGPGRGPRWALSSPTAPGAARPSSRRGCGSWRVRSAVLPTRSPPRGRCRGGGRGRPPPVRRGGWGGGGVRVGGGAGALAGGGGVWGGGRGAPAASEAVVVGDVARTVQPVGWGS